MVTEIAATLAFSATQNNDKIGLLLFSDQIELFIPPKKGKSHVLRIIRELIEFEPKSKKTDLSQALKYLSSVLKNKDLSGDPTSGTVEAKRFVNISGNAYGTARTAGAGQLVKVKPVVISINDNTEYIEASLVF